jgi:putative transposase
MFLMTDNKWARLLAYVTGLVNQKLLLQNEYLAAENRILRAHLPARIRLSDPQRSTLAEIGKRLGRAALKDVVCVAKPDTIPAWYRRLIAANSTAPNSVLHPAAHASRPKWRRSLSASPEKTPAGDTTGSSVLWPISATLFPIRRWATSFAATESNRHRDAAKILPGRFIASHLAVLAGTDFFTVEVLTWRGLATYYVLFFIHLESRRVSLAGLTRHPNAEWMLQMARNATDESSGFLRGLRYLLHDRDTKFCAAFLAVLRSSGIRPLALPSMSPNLNAFAERWVCSVRQECLSKLILLGESSLRRALNEYVDHYHFERNHQGKSNLLLFPSPGVTPNSRTVHCRERLGGMLKFYSHIA